LTVTVDRRVVAGAAEQPLARVVLAPAFPLDAVVGAVSVNGRPATFERRLRGDIQQAEVVVAQPDAKTSVVFSLDEGTDVYHEAGQPATGDRNEGLRVLRSSAGRDALVLTLEGRAGRTYSLKVRTPRTTGAVSGGVLKATASRDPELVVTFDGAGSGYIRKEVTVALGSRLLR
jgi:hypothetical protein